MGTKDDAGSRYARDRELIKQVLTALRINAREAAGRLGVHESSFSAWGRRRWIPSKHRATLEDWLREHEAAMTRPHARANVTDIADRFHRATVQLSRLYEKTHQGRGIGWTAVETLIDRLVEDNNDGREATGT